MRQTPNSLEAERALIHSVLVYPELYAGCAEIGPQDFLQPAHQEIWEAFGTPPIDPITVRERLSKSAKEVFGTCLLAEGTSMNVDHYVAIVRDRAVRRRLLAAAAELIKQVDDTDKPVDEVVAEAKRALEGMRGAAKLVSFADLADPVMAAIERRVEARERGVQITGARTGIANLDERTAGFQDGWLVVVAGETGSGKTALAMQTVINVCLDGGTALAINLEMPAAELAERAIVHVGEMNSSLVRTGHVVGPDWERVIAGSKALYDKALFFEERAASIDAILGAARRWRAKHAERKAILVVDFVQLIRSTREKGMTRAQEVGLFAQELKALAKDLRLPVVLVSQLNRAGLKGGGRPSKLDLKESGDLENAADLILLNWNKEETGDGPVMIIGDKFRSGERFRIAARWIGRHYKFADAKWEEDRRVEEWEA